MGDTLLLINWYNSHSIDNQLIITREYRTDTIICKSNTSEVMKKLWYGPNKSTSLAFSKIDTILLGSQCNIIWVSEEFFISFKNGLKQSDRTISL